MVQKYQNEIAPTFYYGISTKTNEKDLKIPNLQPPDWKHPYWMTLYVVFIRSFITNSILLKNVYIIISYAMLGLKRTNVYLG